MKGKNQNVQDLNNTVKGTLLFCDNMPDEKPEDPTEIFAWKVSFPLIANKAITNLLTISIEKGLINNENELNMNFVRDIIVG